MEQEEKYRYEEEISLRELIEALLKRKKTIALITMAFIICAGIASFFVIEPSYEAKAMIRLSDAPIGVVDYAAQITNYDVLSSTVADLDLQEKGFDIEKLRRMLTVETIKDTNLIEITAKNSDPALAAGIANEMAVNSKGMFLPVYENMLARTNESIDLIQKMIKESNDELQQASEFVILKKNLVEDEALNAFLSQNNADNRLLSIELSSEEMNTRYVEIQRKIFGDNIALIQKQEEAANLQTKIVNIRGEVEGRLPLNTFMESLVVSKAMTPSAPVSPRKALNLAIGAVLGLMLGAFWAFFMEYWENSAHIA